MREIPKEGQIYRHFKGTYYRIICIARDSETLEEAVVYENRDEPSKKFVRPLAEFMSRTDKDKYPDAPQEYRFEEAEDDKGSMKESADEPSVAKEDDVPAVLLEFLDAEGNEEKLDALERGRGKLNDDIISAMAASLDTEIREGDIDGRYAELKEHLITLIKYEGVRLRR